MNPEFLIGSLSNSDSAIVEKGVDFQIQNNGHFVLVSLK